MSPRTVTILILTLLSTACGSKKKAESADSLATSDSPSQKDEPPTSDEAKTASGDSETKTDGPKKDECAGSEIGNLEDVLNRVACEVPNPKPDEKALDPKDRLDVKISTSTPKVMPGQHVDIVVTLANKGKEPLPLLFTIDPTPRFSIEAYDAKAKRADIPPGQPPALPKGVAPRVPGEPKTAKVTIAAGGAARLRLGWDAVRTKWAPDKLRGTPPERGYPRTPNGPLPKGKYTLKVVMPLVGVLEGVEKEVSAPKLPIEVGN